MSSIGSSFLDYSALFNSSSSTSSTSGTSSLYNKQTQSVSSYFQYGVNNSKSLTDAQAESMLSFKDAANTLTSALSKILSKKNDGGSVFTSYKAVSSDANSISASYANDVGKYSSEAFLAKKDASYAPGAPENLSVKTVQLAQTQINTSSLKSGELAVEEGQTYKFEITVGGKAKELSISAESGDTNESIQKKIASAINDEGIGVKASVVKNGITGESTLSIESRETGIDSGAERAFEIKDKDGSDFVSRMGLDNMTREAQNAQYYVSENGGQAQFKESKSNDVQLTDRTSATLKATTDNYVSINFESGSTEGINAVREMVNGFNALYEAASSGSTAKSQNLARQLQGLYETYSSSLQNVGISMTEGGYLKIDEAKMQSAADNGDLAKVFSNEGGASNYGFANRLQTIAKGVSDNPTQYVTGATKAAEEASSENIWDRLESSTSSSSYSKLYFNMQRYENMGSLFNSMF